MRSNVLRTSYSRRCRQESLQRLRRLARRLVALVRLLGHHGKHDLAQTVRHQWVEFHQRRGLLGRMPQALTNQVIVWERRLPGQDMIKSATKAVEVGTDVHPA